MPAFEFNYDWVIEKSVLASSLPTTVYDVQELHNLGIKTIISLCDGSAVHDVIVNSSTGMNHLVIEIPDFSIPDEYQTSEFLEFMNNSPDLPVAIHCFAGIGRTGTLIALYLIRSRNMGAKEAIRYVRSKRPGAIESRKQEIFLYKQARENRRI
ncbi:MAG: phosphatase domain-containing protein [Candidatus Hodarchaeales archaeon]